MNFALYVLSPIVVSIILAWMDIRLYKRTGWAVKRGLFVFDIVLIILMLGIMGINIANGIV